MTNRDRPPRDDERLIRHKRLAQARNEELGQLARVEAELSPGPDQINRDLTHGESLREGED